MPFHIGREELHCDWLATNESPDSVDIKIRWTQILGPCLWENDRTDQSRGLLRVSQPARLKSIDCGDKSTIGRVRKEKAIDAKKGVPKAFVEILITGKLDLG